MAAYRWYMLGIVATMLATEFQTVAVGWQLYVTTGDPLSLGLLGLAGFIPFASTVLIAGVVADRLNRRSIVLAALTALLLCSVALTILTASGTTTTYPWMLYGAVVISGFARSFLMPARGALGADLVPAELLELATRLRSTVVQLSSVMGRCLSGVIYACGIAVGLGAACSYAATGVLLIGALLATFLIQAPVRPRIPTSDTMFDSLTGGVRYVLGHRILLGAMVLDLLGVFFGDAIVLLPMFADRILHVGPEGLGLLRAAPSAGAVVMAVLMARMSPFANAGRTLLVAVAGFGISQAAFALTTSFPLAAVFLACGGALDFISVVIRNALIQVLTPAPLLGRVTAVGQVFIWSSNELGAFESGAAARLFGLVPSVVAGGGVTVLITALTAWRNPALRRLRRITTDALPHPTRATHPSPAVSSHDADEPQTARVTSTA